MAVAIVAVVMVKLGINKTGHFRGAPGKTPAEGGRLVAEGAGNQLLGAEPGGGTGIGLPRGTEIGVGLPKGVAG